MRIGLFTKPNVVGAAGLAVPEGPRVAPESLCLWVPGPFRGDFGECLWDEDAARMVMAEYGARGNPLPIDVEHNTNLEKNPDYDPEDPPVGGGYVWLRLEQGADGPSLCLDPIQWSDYARGEIEGGSRRCISPDWDFDPSTGRVVRLNKISLVQNPGTYHIGLMASARAGKNGNAMDLTMLKSMVAGLLALAESAQDPELRAQATELAEKVQALAASFGFDLDAVDPGVDPNAGSPAAVDPSMLAADDAQKPADEQQKVMAAALAGAMALLSKGKTAGKAAAAPAQPVDVRSIVRQEVRHELGVNTAKQNLIAAARRAGKPMNEALAVQILAMPLEQARNVIAALPKPETGATATAAAAGHGGGGQGPVKVGPHGTTTGSQLSSGDARSVDMIQRAARSRDERIAEARSAQAAASGAPALGEDGSFTFSALGQMSTRAPLAAKA